MPFEEKLWGNNMKTIKTALIDDIIQTLNFTYEFDHSQILQITSLGIYILNVVYKFVQETLVFFLNINFIIV